MGYLLTMVLLRRLNKITVFRIRIVPKPMKQLINLKLQF